MSAELKTTAVAPDDVLPSQDEENGTTTAAKLGKESLSTSRGQQANPGDHACALIQVSRCPEQPSSSGRDDVSSQSMMHKRFVQDLLENLLSCATSRSVPQQLGVRHQSLRRPTGKPTIHPSTGSANDVNVNTSHILSSKNADSDSNGSANSSPSETDSSGPDSDNDSTLLTRPISEPEADPEPDTLLLTKNEQDANKIHIPLLDFVITEQHTLVKVGTVSAVLQNAVVVTTFNLAQPPRQLSDTDICNTTALDTGSLLCFSDRTILGAVFETFGPVASPLYVVRFNASDEIPAAARAGAEVLYVEQEMRLVRGRDVRGKGYDASGKDDEEADAEEFSDDEMERQSKKMKRSSGLHHHGGPVMRGRGHDGRLGQVRKDRIVKRREGYGRDRDRFARQGMDKRWSTGPASGREHHISRSYNSGAIPHNVNGISSPRQQLMPQPRYEGGRSGRAMRGAATIPGFHIPGIPLSVPSSAVNLPEAAPGSALNAMPSVGDYSYHLPHSVLPGVAPPYTVASQATVQPQFMYPGQSWQPQMNSYVNQDPAYSISSYQQYGTTQEQAGQIPRRAPSQIHQHQDQMSGLQGHHMTGMHNNAGERYHQTSGAFPPQVTSQWRGFPSERYHYGPPG